ncbi:MAG: glutaredoxin family protein [SAR202 cluster bacterium]|nr:glutaredoxin family protein [SAR202 cluster bacterium]
MPAVEKSDLIVYTRYDCAYCDALKHDLDHAGTEYQEINIIDHPEYQELVEKLAGGERITPVMVEGDKVVVGYRGIGCAY